MTLRAVSFLDHAHDTVQEDMGSKSKADVSKTSRSATTHADLEFFCCGKRGHRETECGERNLDR